MSDLYKELGVRKDADKSAIKKAYRKKARVLHPDKQGGNREQFMQLQIAYDVLMDDEKRDLYDRTGITGKQRSNNDEASILMLNKMMTAVDRFDDFVTAVISSLKSEKDALIREIQDYKNKAKVWREKASRVKHKPGGENLVAETLKHNAQNADRTACSGEERLKIYIKAITMAEEYEYKQDPQATPAPFTFWTGILK